MRQYPEFIILDHFTQVRIGNEFVENSFGAHQLSNFESLVNLRLLVCCIAGTHHVRQWEETVTDQDLQYGATRAYNISSLLIIALVFI